MQARRLTAQEGMLWLVSGYRLYRANPPLLIGLTVSYIFLSFAVSLLPIIGTIAVFVGSPILVVMVANGCRAIDEGHSRPLPVQVLLDGIQSRRAPLIHLGLIYLVGLLLAFVIGQLISNLIGAPDAFDPANPDLIGLMRILLPSLAVASPLFCAYWFAPLLTAWQGVAPAKSLFFSLVACLRNWVAFTAFVVATMVATLLPGMVLGLLASMLPGGETVFSMLMGLLMMFVMAPILMTSVYIGYREIFIHAQESPAS